MPSNMPRVCWTPTSWQAYHWTYHWAYLDNSALSTNFGLSTRTTRLPMHLNAGCIALHR